MSREATRGIPRRTGFIVLKAIAVLYAAYLIAANVLLHTSILERKLDKAFAGSIVGVHVTHGAAWSFFPGHMWVRNATVRCYNYDVEWILQVDDHVAWLNPFAMAWRSVHVMRARGKGVRFRLRYRRDRDAPLDAEAAWIPPIEGMPDPPVHPDVPRPPPTGPHDVVWSMVFNRLDMQDVREVWIGKYHWIDSSRTRGRFSMTPGRSLSVALQMEMRSGEMLIGDEVALEGATGHLKIAIAPMKLDGPQPTPLIPNLSAGAQMAARITSLRLFAPLLESGTLDARIALDGGIRGGVIRDGTIADLSIAKAEVRKGEWNVKGLGELSICVSHPAGKPSQLVASAELDRLDASQTGPPASAVTLRGGRLEANLASPWVDVGKPFDPGEGRMRLDVKTAAFRMKDLTVHGSVSTLLRLAARRPPGGSVETAEPASPRVYHLDGTYMEVRNAFVTRGSLEPSDAGWWGRMDLPELEVRPATPAVRARVVAKLRDANLVLTVVNRFVAFPVSFIKLLTSGAVEARATIHSRPAVLALDGLEATGGDSLRTKGWLLSDHATKHGAFLVEIGKKALGIHVTPAKTELVMKSPREWFAGVADAKAGTMAK